MKIKDIIKRLQELNNEECIVNMEVKPIIECFEDLYGNGIETIKYQYTIEIEGKETTQKYKNNHGIKEYLKKEEE